ncbi:MULTISPECIES: site-specific DNA-methyltransferase [unclassified Geobacillus]|uniref:site-specific DNA-methyltransferase n=1 Tax=unclassified Geobacillus TaxID=2642459 RepID=UPI000BE4469C|nr:MULTISPECIES: site-specific DNA-methyltransferase [unclassified Geobacillus]PDM40471.1 site-specific DNA-methyltransferase [Parageobacillus yumthangensis]PUF90164.1 site-specific DNA-methyltransferase [Geobacillus sp. LYN3]RDV22798.1 site-specific DNA-methyltransferase [Parageobacillus toebii]TXK87474.1 site-specific DNA-methyltransferase [Geobacillus sp. AYS3]
MEKLDGKSMDIVKTNIEALKQLFPEVVTEGKIDFEKLKLILGEEIETRNEKYEFTWHGKTQAMKLAQTPSTGTLRPDKASSKNWDTTENLYIEGDNLEVLKLLQKSYFGKIKMIYIDPPYNTGKDFVYKDDFRDNIKNYKEITKQTTKANTETSGRYHTDWLNMMYPRLKLARNLLREDGVIFISIDDTEAANLRKLCDEVFGENNFVTTFIWQRAYAPVNMNKFASRNHDFILCYAKKIDCLSLYGLSRSEEANSRYKNPDNDPRGVWKSDNLSAGPVVESKVYPITTPSGRVVYPPKGYCWRVTKERFEELVADNRIWFGEDGNNVPSLKRFLSEVKSTITPLTVWTYQEVSHSQDAKKELKELFDDQSVMDYPKPVKLMKRILELSTRDHDIVLDFFSGSATTAHAVMQLNAEDGGNRKFIMVQLPEKTDEKSEAYKAGYKNICEIGKERIRRAGEKIVKETGKTDLDIGFKVFKLDSSNVKTWDPDFDNLEQTLFDLQDNIKEDRTKEDLLYEILLKIGLPLTIPIEEIDYNGKTIYNVAYGSVLVCLEDDIDLDIVQEMLKYQSEHMPPKVIFKESGFISDAVKTNAIQTLKKHGITDVRSV